MREGEACFLTNIRPMFCAQSVFLNMKFDLLDADFGIAKDSFMIFDHLWLFSTML